MPLRNIPLVDLRAQHDLIRDDLETAISEVIDQSAFIRSKPIKQFEETISRMLGIKNCISCGNGTDALHITLKGLGLKPGDEVITTSHSWISTSEAITNTGGKVVFCDTNPDTFTIDPKYIEDLITPNTVGIIPVHLYGHPADMHTINKIASKHSLWVVEDCAQAILAQYKGEYVGTLSNASIFSFYPGKNLGAMGDAGCILTNDTNLAEWCSLYSNHGGKGKHLFEGINSRLDGLQASILNVKISHLSKWTRQRVELADYYNSHLSDIPDIQTPTIGKECNHVYHLYTIKTKFRDQLRDYLKNNNIASSINYPIALPFLPAYKRLNHSPSDFPNTYENQKVILSLPLYPELELEDINRVISTITNFVDLNSK